MVEKYPRSTRENQPCKLYLQGSPHPYPPPTVTCKIDSAARGSDACCAANRLCLNVTTGFIVRTVKAVNSNNCAFFDTNSKLVYLIEFEVLKNIGLGPQCQRGF
jgi:hypothetical protein